MGTWLFWIAVIALFTWGWWLENWWVVGLGILVWLPLVALFYGLLNVLGWILGSRR